MIHSPINNTCDWQKGWVIFRSVLDAFNGVVKPGCLSWTSVREAVFHLKCRLISSYTLDRYVDKIGVNWIFVDWIKCTGRVLLWKMRRPPLSPCSTLPLCREVRILVVDLFRWTLLFLKHFLHVFPVSWKKVTVRFAFSVQVSYLTWSVLPGIIGGDLSKFSSFRFRRLVFKCVLRWTSGCDYGIWFSYLFHWGVQACHNHFRVMIVKRRPNCNFSIWQFSFKIVKMPNTGLYCY